MNFDYLKDKNKLAELYTLCNEAETFCSQFPRASASCARNALEWVVKLFYLTKKVSIQKLLHYLIWSPAQNLQPIWMNHF